MKKEIRKPLRAKILSSDMDNQSPLIKKNNEIPFFVGKNPMNLRPKISNPQNKVKTMESDNCLTNDSNYSLDQEKMQKNLLLKFKKSQ